MINSIEMFVFIIVNNYFQKYKLSSCKIRKQELQYKIFKLTSILFPFI